MAIGQETIFTQEKRWIQDEYWLINRKGGYFMLKEREMIKMVRSSLLSDLIQKIRSGVLHIKYSDQGKCIGGGSGFFSKGHLITNNHVLPDTKSQIDKIIIAWQIDTSLESRKEISFSKETFMSFLKEGSDENNYDYAILDIPELKEQGLYDFTIKLPIEKKIGEDALVLGFPLDCCSLTCHRGMISSFYSKNIGEKTYTKIIQLDASANNGNSGGPLVDIETGEVFGIITRKETGLTELFDELVKTFDSSVNIFSNRTGMLKLGGLDPIEGLISVQLQMKRLAREILRSANVGIGYAFSSEHVLEALERLTAVDK